MRTAAVPIHTIRIVDAAEIVQMTAGYPISVIVARPRVRQVSARRLGHFVSYAMDWRDNCGSSLVPLELGQSGTVWQPMRDHVVRMAGPIDVLDFDCATGWNYSRTTPVMKLFEKVGPGMFAHKKTFWDYFSTLGMTPLTSASFSKTWRNMASFALKPSSYPDLVIASVSPTENQRPQTVSLGIVFEEARRRSGFVPPDPSVTLWSHVLCVSNGHVAFGIIWTTADSKECTFIGVVSVEKLNLAWEGPGDSLVSYCVLSERHVIASIEYGRFKQLATLSEVGELLIYNGPLWQLDQLPPGLLLATDGAVFTISPPITNPSQHVVGLAALCGGKLVCDVDGREFIPFDIVRTDHGGMSPNQHVGGGFTPIRTNGITCVPAPEWTRCAEPPNLAQRTMDVYIGEAVGGLPGSNGPREIILSLETINAREQNVPFDLPVAMLPAYRVPSEYHAELPPCYKCGVNIGHLVCMRCENAAYCSRECQVAHWPEHSKTCLK